MNEREQQLKDTVIAVLQYTTDSNDPELNKKLLPIITKAEFQLNPKWNFAIRPNQHYEDLQIRIPIPLMDETKEYLDEIVHLIKNTYQETDNFALGSVSINPQYIGSKYVSDVSDDVKFSEIQNTVIQGLRSAKFIVYVAVAWFTNEMLYSELLKASESGVTVKVILSDEESNKPIIEKMKADHIEHKIVSRYGFNDWNRMHDKFCVIDLEYVMHGSYNWTKTADYNHETLAITSDRAVTLKFANEFQRMYQEG